VASLIIDAPADVVAIGESNGEPELLEWLSLDCDNLVVVELVVVVLAGNEYSSGFVMAITEFRISGVSGVVVHVPTVKFDVLVTDGADAGTTATEAVGTMSTFNIGTPFMLSLKL